MNRYLAPALLALALIASLAASQALYIVDQTQQAVVLRLGAPDHTVNVADQDNAGLHIKLPFADTVVRFDRQSQALEIDGQDMQVEAFEQSLIRHARPKRSDEHPTMKPVGLIERFLRNSSLQGDLVLDPFGGSGSTLIACERADRLCFMMELEPHYCDVIVKRWEDFTGSKAQRL